MAFFLLFIMNKLFVTVHVYLQIVGGGIAIKQMTRNAKHSPNMVAHNVRRSVGIEH